MNFKTYISVSFLVFCLVAACTSRIDISTDDAPERLVIYGYITTDTMHHSIRITRSAGYFSTGRPEGISDAMVSISTDDTVFTMTESDTLAGLYLTAGDVYGIEGKEYRLNVKVDFDGDGQPEEYEAVSGLPYAARLDSIKFRQSTAFDDFVEIRLWGRIPGEDDEKSFMSFHAYRNGLVVNDSLIGFSLIDDEYVGEKEVKGVSCFYMDQEDERALLSVGDSVTFKVDAITEDYFYFIDEAQNEINGSIPIFTGPPSNVRTNIRVKNGTTEVPVAGFFTAYSTRSVSSIFYGLE